MNWEETVARLGPRLYNYFIRRGLLTDASDLTQEVFIRLYQKITSGEYSNLRGPVDAFAFGIARFVILENNQKTKWNQPTDKDFDWESISDNKEATDIVSNYERKETVTLFLQEIKDLSVLQQDILSLYMDEDLTLESIAALLDLPVGTVKSHLHRCKSKLKLLLEAKGINL